jgi:hypothetical protein
MTQEVIDRVLALGRKENVPSGVIIRNLHGDVEVNDFETDDIEGVYGYDLQQNLYPNIQHEDNNQTTQNGEAETNDVTDSDSDPDSDSESTNDNNNDYDEDNKSNIEIIQNENRNQQPQETVVEDVEGDLESIVQELEQNMDAEIEAFNDMDNNINNVLEDLEQDFDKDDDETPVKRNRKLTTDYEPSFNNKSYAQIKGVQEDNKVDDATFIQILQKVFMSQQMSLKKGLKLFGDKAVEGMKKELSQLHMRDSFIPKHKKDLTTQQWKNRCEAVNLIKQKKNGEIKGRCCADGRSQRNYISKEESASPTVATESVLLTSIIEAKENRKVVTLDVPNAFIQTYLENKDERIILVLRGLAADLLIDIEPKYKEFVEVEKGQSVLYLECTNVIYGTLKAALLFYQKFRKDIKAKGFTINPYDRCVANKVVNGKQMTVLWHVDDLKASHKEQVVLDEFEGYLRSIYDDDEIGKIKVNHGPRHEFLGMTLDYSQPGKVIIDMVDYVKNMVSDFNYEIKKSAKTPAADHLFKINNNCKKLNKTMAEDFHTFVAKGLFVCKRARPDIQTAIVFLTTRVTNPDEDDWKKLIRLMSYLKGTTDLVLTLEADDLYLIKWFIDGSLAVHNDMKGHTRGGMTLGKGSVINKSTKQKINTKSSTET